ncbi:MAG: TetR/AcrR family transcriptional regulator [Pseudomonadota bacterium]
MAMARPRSFDDETVRSALLQAFWTHGYDGTALPQLEEATGLSRKSLYNAFGDKQAMFVRALQDFRQTAVRANTEPLRAEGASLAAIEAVLRGLVDLAETSQGRLGCMVCNTSREDVADIPDVRQEIDAYFNALERAMRQAIETGQAKGEIAQRPPDDLARLCLGAVVSMSVLAKAGQPVPVLRSIAEETLKALR